MAKKNIRGVDAARGVDIFEEKQPEWINHETLKQDTFFEII